MGYRDEGEAAMHRVASLEHEVAEARAETAGIQQSLAQANAEIVRLRGNPIALPEPKNRPVPPANLLLLRGLLVASGAALLALAAASYSSERGGMAVAQVTVPLCGATIAAWVRRREPMKGVLIAALAWGLVCFVSLLLFFGTIWRSL